MCTGTCPQQCNQRNDKTNSKRSSSFSTGQDQNTCCTACDAGSTAPAWSTTCSQCHSSTNAIYQTPTTVRQAHTTCGFREHGTKIKSMRANEFVTEKKRMNRLKELTFMGMSPCTKDCSGHRAGYRWSKARGGVSTASWSNSFNKGAEIAKAGY